MVTTLKLLNTEKPYEFESMGVLIGQNIYKQSSLFPIGTVVKLTSGKFPLDNHKNIRKSKMTHRIGNKKVRLTGFTSDCEVGYLNKYSPCTIDVVGVKKGGTRCKRRSSSN